VSPRVRSLDPEEAELWARVTASIRPLSRERVEPPLAVADSAESVEGRQPAPRRSHPAPRARIAPAPAPKRALATATLDSSWDRKLRSGRLDPDRVLDLHGMNLDGAWQAIDRVLEQAIASGERVVLLITGHHRPGDPPVVRGRIRAAVHDWLAASRHAPRIAAVRGAHRRHGGGGSLYIVLRRR
jgi:DNA-nicking Smr family endonuclease